MMKEKHKEDIGKKQKAHPHQQAMGCLLGAFGKKITILRTHNIKTLLSSNCYSKFSGDTLFVAKVIIKSFSLSGAKTRIFYEI